MTILSDMAANDFFSDLLFGKPEPVTIPFAFAQKAQTDNRHPVVVDPFWVSTAVDIDAARWNQRFPYQLLVLDVADDGTYSVDPAWEFTLPIPPENVTISNPFAIQTRATLDGIVEQHNGAPFRSIAMRGTTGVLPNRDSTPSSGVRRTAFLGIFAGTTQSVSTTVTTGLALGTKPDNLMDEGDLANGEDKGRGTGYYQFRLLSSFLSAYVTLKKSPAGNRKRLAVSQWKEQALYIVTPVSFEVTKDGSADPLAYRYALMFKAWRSISLSTESPTGNSAAGRADSYREILNALQEARVVLDGARDAIGAIRGDAGRVFEHLRQSMLFVKDALGLIPTLADLPSNIAKDGAAALADFMQQGSALADLRNSPDLRRVPVAQQEIVAQQLLDLVEAGNRADQTAFAREVSVRNASPAAKILANPGDYPTLMALFDTSRLRLSTPIAAQIQSELTRIRKLRRQDFETMQTDVQSLADYFADVIGEGSATYSDTYQRPTATQTKTATEDDFAALWALQSVVLEMARLINTAPQPHARLDAIDFVAGLASRSGIAFTTPTSKLAIPFPYGATLEQLALQYLGDANRWMEIAALNGLRSPYVDEEGFDLSLIGNGRNHEVLVSDITNLFVGQTVLLSSDVLSPVKHRITQIQALNPTIWSVYVDGDETLETLLTTDHAILHAYLPDTVSSQMQLYIPSPLAADDEELITRNIPGLPAFDSLLEVGGVDMLVNLDGDLVLTPDGTTVLAYGLNNLVQRARIALSTPRGSLPQHPTFGLGIQAGVSTADLDARQLLAAAKGLFRDDPAFTGVTTASVTKNGPAISLSIQIGVRGQDTVLPITIDVT